MSVTVMASLLVFALVVIVNLLLVIVWGAHRCVTEHQSDHAKCIAHIASVTSDRVVALAFHEAAERYDSIEGKADTSRLVREKYNPDGPSVPALWMREQGEKLNPQP